MDINIEAPIVLTTKQSGLAKGYSAYEVAVINGFVGTEQQWLNSLVGEQGEQGEQGLPGLNGSDGDSAYQVALDNGFVGTEQQWLDSLNGDDAPSTMSAISFTPYNLITSITGQAAVEQLYDLSVENYSNNDASSIIVNTTDVVQNINLTSGSGDLNLSLGNYPTKSGLKTVIVNNNRGTDVNINLPTSNYINGSITYVYHKTEDSLTVLSGRSGEILFRFHFISATICQIRISVIAFDYIST